MVGTRNSLVNGRDAGVMSELDDTPVMTCVRMDTWIRRALERVAEAEDRSLSFVILWILAEWIKANPEWMRPPEP